MRSCFLAFLAIAPLLAAKPVFSVRLDRSSAVYACGEAAVFTIAATDDAGGALPAAATLRLTNDGGRLIQETTVDFSARPTQSLTATMEQPGFLRLMVSAQYDGTDGHPETAVKYGGAAFDPGKLAAARPEPADFLDFWLGEVAKADEEIPLDAQIVRLDSFSNDRHTAYEVSFAAPGGRVYGFLCVPARPGKKPALVSVPGAGPGVGAPELNDEFVTLIMNVHPYDPRTEGKSLQELYDELNRQGIYMCQGGASRQGNFYHRAIIGIVRALDWLARQEDVDAQRIGYYGSSQGGAFGFILGGLTRHFAAIVCNVPALCDHYAVEMGRSPGWPSFLYHFQGQPDLDEMVPYYDAVNFARHLEAPIRVIVGFIDTTCSPSSVYAAFNALASKDKAIHNEIDMMHEVRQSYGDAINWLKQRLAPRE